MLRNDRGTRKLKCVNNTGPALPARECQDESSPLRVLGGVDRRVGHFFSDTTSVPAHQ